MTNNTLLELFDIHKSYKDKVVLAGLKLLLAKNQCVGIVGRNGTGKTTMLKIISGLLTRFTGTLNTYQHTISALIDTPVFINDFTGRENIEYMLDIDLRAKAVEITNNLGITDYLDKKVKKYSQGMRQKLAIAMILSTDADIILLDEPFNSIDIESTSYIISLINQMKSQNKGIIVVTHNLTRIQTYCDQIYTLKNGILETYDKMTELNLKQYRIQFETEQDLLSAQSVLGEYTINIENNNTMLISFNNGNLPTILKRLSGSNIININENANVAGDDLMGGPK
ncbi:MAG: ABC transporter ATP-binding protein [Christensenellaceae bacterium]|jgi:ABC-type multidrug transport system ATPase subunit|nr:ABC transporter ATP-binding protein [Christensenellaceae bacterium]